MKNSFTEGFKPLRFRKPETICENFLNYKFSFNKANRSPVPTTCLLVYCLKLPQTHKHCRSERNHKTTTVRPVRNCPISPTDRHPSLNRATLALCLFLSAYLSGSGARDMIIHKAAATSSKGKDVAQAEQRCRIKKKLNLKCIKKIYT